MAVHPYGPFVSIHEKILDVRCRMIATFVALDNGFWTAAVLAALLKGGSDSGRSDLGAAIASQGILEPIVGPYCGEKHRGGQ